jgi:hypothetical protein
MYQEHPQNSDGGLVKFSAEEASGVAEAWASGRYRLCLASLTARQHYEDNENDWDVEEHGQDDDGNMRCGWGWWRD